MGKCPQRPNIKKTANSLKWKKIICSQREIKERYKIEVLNRELKVIHLQKGDFQIESRLFSPKGSMRVKFSNERLLLFIPKFNFRTIFKS